MNSLIERHTTSRTDVIIIQIYGLNNR